MSLIYSVLMSENFFEYEFYTRTPRSLNQNTLSNQLEAHQSL